MPLVNGSLDPFRGPIEFPAQRVKKCQPGCRAVCLVGLEPLYQRFAATWQLRALFYGIAPAVVALIVRACWNLGRKTLRTDVRAWLFFTIACAVTVVVEREIAWMFIIAGLLGALVFGERAGEGAGAPLSIGGPLGAIVLPIYGTTSKLFLFFFKTGLLVFGSGLVIVPFLKAQVVDEYHWLTNHQFLDAVAIGMISPGPVVITATFVGYLLDGVAGALAATLGIFTPPVLFVLCATPLLLRYRNNARLRGFVRGVGTAVVGVSLSSNVCHASRSNRTLLTSRKFAKPNQFSPSSAYKSVPDWPE